ncbi:unnamed protein product [Fraxinus pennsylvanica]|uniref:D-isomer specific 2-hydroxyacid dehydrogenase NAD-binding domain-containing protein n=1 Tax=Fraxinus pennsylvanica TaxID=56036 RepID=A0AAD1ZU73_9LAMI|nr:unnamed protein product [Fraxinus pennsylvanica]
MLQLGRLEWLFQHLPFSAANLKNPAFFSDSLLQWGCNAPAWSIGMVFSGAAVADSIDHHHYHDDDSSKPLSFAFASHHNSGRENIKITGGVIDEEALVKALDLGIVAQAALDVFIVEPPPKDNKLVQHVNVTATPHFGASTTEAQEGVAIEIAEAVVGALKGELAATALSAPMVPSESIQLQTSFLNYSSFSLFVRLLASPSPISSITACNEALRRAGAAPAAMRSFAAPAPLLQVRLIFSSHEVAVLIFFRSMLFRSSSSSSSD